MKKKGTNFEFLDASEVGSLSEKRLKLSTREESKLSIKQFKSTNKRAVTQKKPAEQFKTFLTFLRNEPKFYSSEFFGLPSYILGKFVI